MQKIATNPNTNTTDNVSAGRVTSVNVSAKKGTRKTPVSSGTITVQPEWGVKGDAHADNWHRQISFLSEESIAKAVKMGLDVKAGDFAENVTTSGLELFSLPIGTIFKIGADVVVEISQIGKVCHTRCAIYHLAGDCIFPREGIFGVIRTGGDIRTGDDIIIDKLGSGACSATPPEAVAEVEAARAAGTL